ncbi:energy-coupling factor transporter transmembrane protein EcfT [Corynebacterium sp. HS2168-gen11]|uniref:energy-coupling factor transporter transmembrane component T family protein n=1 Tax=Corynebacterium sp. HS2168-gen11 TaxID=2974027 RepID=UPI00216AF121|nr:energy-coupling factor transporter transmembrane protein EcfT [Corynebacterium sp. HS2168-gen11]MCS4536346.1 energy-coupling factor transporter transmembrane protein EcfT [Corynebacterium sp. HS2168-gen11]
MRTVPMGLFVPGNSIVHRVPPLLKILILISYIAITSIVSITIPIALVCTVACLGCYVFARIPWKIMRGQLGLTLPLVLLIGLFHWWAHDRTTAIIFTLVLFSAISLAILITLTTALQAMTDAVEALLRPLARFGLPVETITLTVAMTLRLLPLILAMVYEILDARRARGATLSLQAFGIPFMIRAIRRARGLGDALYARGVGS